MAFVSTIEVLASAFAPYHKMHTTDYNNHIAPSIAVNWVHERGKVYGK